MSNAGQNAFLSEPANLDLGDPHCVLLRASFDLNVFEQSLFAHFYVALPDALTRAVSKRQAEYLAGRMLCQRALAQLGQQTQQIPIGDARAPIWPKGISGSITHSKGQVACLLTTRPDCCVGIDIEHELTQSALKSVKQVTLRDSEIELLIEHTKLNEAQIARAIFSAKETLFKALYPRVQKFFGFNAATCTSVRDTSLHLELTRDLHPNMPEGSTFNIQMQMLDGHVLTWLMHQA